MHRDTSGPCEAGSMTQAQEQAPKYPIHVLPYTIYTVQLVEVQNMPERANRYYVVARKPIFYEGAGEYVIVGDFIVKKTVEELLVQDRDGEYYVVRLARLLMDNTKGWTTITMSFEMESVDNEEAEKLLETWQHLEERVLLSYYLHKEIEKIRKHLAW